ncbi:uncharacterized protein [Centruroides vittatus]|uniref:uncharacterized protein n=1 Tax=Centruroides vittatus TaxID=120091 RepID=UPI00350EEFCA
MQIILNIETYNEDGRVARDWAKYIQDRLSSKNSWSQSPGLDFGFLRALYDNFISIQRFSVAKLPLEFKLKMNDFMKRFGKIPLGISMGGFFYIKKHFIIRISGKMGQKKVCDPLQILKLKKL